MPSVVAAPQAANPARVGQVLDRQLDGGHQISCGVRWFAWNTRDFALQRPIAGGTISHRRVAPSRSVDQRAEPRRDGSPAEGAIGVRTAPSRPRLLERDFNSPSDTVLPLDRSANRRMIASPGGSYDVPAFRPTSQSRSAVTAYSWIPHTTTRAILDQAEIGEHLDRSGCFLFPGNRHLAGDALARCILHRTREG